MEMCSFSSQYDITSYDCDRAGCLKKKKMAALS